MSDIDAEELEREFNDGGFAFDDGEDVEGSEDDADVSLDDDEMFAAANEEINRDTEETEPSGDWSMDNDEEEVSDFEARYTGRGGDDVPVVEEQVWTLEVHNGDLMRVLLKIQRDGGVQRKKLERVVPKYDKSQPRTVFEWVISLMNQDEDESFSMTSEERRDVVKALDDAADDVIDEYEEELRELFSFEQMTKYGFDELTSVLERCEINDWCEPEREAINIDGSFALIDDLIKGADPNDEILNFELIMNEKMQMPEGGETAEFVINHEDEGEVTKLADPEILSDKQKFNKEILSTFYSTVLRDKQIRSRYNNNKDSGKVYDIMNVISECVGHSRVPELQGVNEIGVHDDKFVTPQGSIDESGWVDEDDETHKVVHYHSETRIHKDDNFSRSSIDAEEVREMMELLLNLRPADRLTPVLGWFFYSPHASEIMENQGMINPLNIVGEPGSGKTRTARTLMNLIGYDIDGGEGIENTSFAIDNILQSVKDFPVWFDEYKPSQISEYDMKKFMDKYKKASTGGVSTRGSYDGSDRHWDLLAPVVVTGESEITDNSLARRTINVRFSDETVHTEKYSNAFERLTNKKGEKDFDLHGFAEHFFKFALRERSVEEEFDAANDWVKNELIDDWSIELGDDEVQGLTAVRFGWEMMRRFADEYGVDSSELPTEEDLVESLHHVAGVDEDGNGTGRMTEEDEFLSLLSRAAASDYVDSGKDYSVVHADSDDAELRFNVSRCYDKLSKYAREHDIDVGLLNEGREYRSRFHQLAEEDSSYVITKSQRTPGCARCVGVRIRDVIDSVDAFTPSAFDVDVGVEFDDDVVESGEEEESEDDDVMRDERTGNEIKKLSELEVGDELQSVTVEVVSWETNAGALALDGCVKDVSGMMNVVSFNDVAGSIEEGDCLVLSGVSVDEYQGNMQLRLGDETVINRVQQGVENIPDEESDAGQSVISRSDEAGGKA